MKLAVVLGSYAFIALLSGGCNVQNLEATTSEFRAPFAQAGEEQPRSQTLAISARSLRHLLIDLTLYSLAISPVILLIQNRRLKREIQQRQRVERHLRATEQRYETLAEAVPIGVFCSDAAGQCSYVNKHWCQITGHTPEMAAAGGWHQTLHPQDRSSVSAAWSQAIQESRSTQLEYRIQRPDGTVLWVYGQTVVERDARGQVSGYMGTLTDIDIRKRSEQALQQSEAHYRVLVSVLPDLIMRISRAGIFLEFLASPNFRVLGEPEDWIGTHVSDMLPSEMSQARLAAIEQVLQTQTTMVYEQDFVVEGDIQFEEVRVVPYGQDEVLFLVRDVSDRKQAELALKKSEAKSHAIVSAIPDYLVCVGTDGIYRKLAVPDRDFALVRRTDLAGRTLAEVLPAEFTRNIFITYKRLCKPGTCRSLSIPFGSVIAR